MTKTANYDTGTSPLFFEQTHAPPANTTQSRGHTVTFTIFDIIKKSHTNIYLIYIIL